MRCDAEQEQLGEDLVGYWWQKQVFKYIFTFCLGVQTPNEVFKRCSNTNCLQLFEQ